MLPVPRARLCHDELPARARPATDNGCTRRPRFSAQAASSTTESPAAAKQATPSARAIASSSRASSSSSRPLSASTALPRLCNSFARFQAITSSRGVDLTPTAVRSAATCSTRSSTPLG